MGKNRIAFISEHASPLAMPGSIDAGGQNVYVRELAIELSKLGFEIDIYTRNDNASLPEVVDLYPGTRVIHVTAGPRKYIPKEQLMNLMDEFSSNMMKFISRHSLGYQLVHANFWMSGMVAMTIKKFMKIPFVITFHALGIVRAMHQKEADKFPKRRIFIEKKIVNNADRIIAECPQDEEDLKVHYLATDGSLEIVPCGFNPSEFNTVSKSHAREKLGLDMSENIILSLGRIVPRKGIDNIIQSLKYLKNTTANIKLLIVGGDSDPLNDSTKEEVNRLKRIAADEHVLENIQFVGPKQPHELKYFYSAADVFISTPWYEPFGITPLESMACGTPVIGSNVGGIKYTVLDGETGFLVPPKEPSILAEKTNMLLENKLLLQRMGKAAIARVNNTFTWEKVALKLKNTYLELLLQKSQERLVIENAYLKTMNHIPLSTVAKRQPRSVKGFKN